MPPTLTVPEIPRLSATKPIYQCFLMFDELLRSSWPYAANLARSSDLMLRPHFSPKIHAS
jgi:hypothetical protein